jgi:hypothetical protein
VRKDRAMEEIYYIWQAGLWYSEKKYVVVVVVNCSKNIVFFWTSKQ